MSNKSRYETAIRDMNKFDKGTAHIANEWIDPYRQELEQQKGELIEFVSKLSEAKYFDDYKKLNKQIILILSKHKTKNT